MNEEEKTAIQQEINSEMFRLKNMEIIIELHKENIERLKKVLTKL